MIYSVSQQLRIDRRYSHAKTDTSPGFRRAARFGARAGVSLRPHSFDAAAAEHGNIFALKLANQNVAILVGPENHKVFFSETDKALSIQEPYSFLRTTFGEVLFLARHEVYLEQRPVVLEAFRREKMLHYADVMQEVVQAWLSGLGNSGEIGLVSEITHLVQEVAGNCFLGREVHQLGREFWDLYIDLSKALESAAAAQPAAAQIYSPRPRQGQDARHLAASDRRAPPHPERYDDFYRTWSTSAILTSRLAELIVNILLALMFARPQPRPARQPGPSSCCCRTRTT